MKYKLPETLVGYKIFMVGIKGTGMAALAELLTKQGAIITGSDVPQRFFTDEILENAGIKFFTEFNSSNLSDDINMVIHSSAYKVDENPELIEASKRGLPVLIYTEALGFISSLHYSVGISGIHGKTTTTAICGTILKELKLPVSTLVGSGVPTFNNSAVDVIGNKYFVAETCEYYRHFLDFTPKIIVITSIEMDHPDYFKGIEDIIDAFKSYILKLPEGGEVIYYADDKYLPKLVTEILKDRSDIKFTPYGKCAQGPFRIIESFYSDGTNNFKINLVDKIFKLKVPGFHTVLDSVAGMAVAKSLLEREGLKFEDYLDLVGNGINKFSGTKRRSEIVGDKDGVLYIDDYGHHPTAIETTLKGYKDFYPNRRIIVDFMSHTYSRTSELLDEFASSFTSADIVILNKIYSSAREKYSGSVDGEVLYKECKKYHNNVYYCPEYEDAVKVARELLQPGDVFITMGAGNNWQVGDMLLKEQK